MSIKTSKNLNTLYQLTRLKFQQLLSVASYDPKNCFPIRVPTDDPFWKGSITCMEFTRSLSAPNLDCSFGFKEQVNIIEQEYTRRKLLLTILR